MADNLTTLMCQLSWNLVASTSWNLLGLSRPVMGLLYFTYVGPEDDVIWKVETPINSSLDTVTSFGDSRNVVFVTVMFSENRGMFLSEMRSGWSHWFTVKLKVTYVLIYMWSLPPPTPPPIPSNVTEDKWRHDDCRNILESISGHLDK
jgi:hypothetical protein